MTLSTSAIGHKKKIRLLSGSALMGLSLALSLGSAQAQMVADVVSNSGATISNSGSTTNVSVTAPTAVIQWNPTATVADADGAYTVLGQGSELRFTGSGNYTVLNQFVDDVGGNFNELVAIRGNVISRSDSDSFGGNIWFQNAGGILVGATGRFDVGSLLLTSRNIDQTGGLFGSEGEIRFRGAGTSGSIINRGEILARNQSGAAYVAMVAPTIVQSNLVEADGSIAYIAAEAVDLTINNGLFDINMIVGAEGGTVINHSGTSENLTSASDQRVYFAALPKNNAITMLVSGNLGFDVTNADVAANGSIILSAGYNITSGTIDNGDVNSGSLSNISFGDTRINGNLSANATGNINVDIAAGQEFAARRDVSLRGQSSVTMTVAGDVTADSLGLYSNGFGTTAGTARLTQTGGNIEILSGYLTIDASRPMDAALPNLNAGTAELRITGGTMTVASGISVYAYARREQPEPTGFGNSTGGNVNVTVSGGTLTAGWLDIYADASGANGSSDVPADGGNATGGTIIANLAGDTNLGSVFADATGSGGSGSDYFTDSGISGRAGAGGNGVGGSVTFTYSRDPALTAPQPMYVQLSAAAIGGAAGVSTLDGFTDTPATQLGAIGGSANAGSINANFSGRFSGENVVLNTEARAGNGGDHFNGGLGGSATGGSMTLNLTDAAGDIAIFNARGEASGGDGGVGRHGNGGAGGNATGGSFTLNATGATTIGTISANYITTETRAGSGGYGSDSISGVLAPASANGGAGGNATGGTISLTANQSANIIIQRGNGDFRLGISAQGGSGGGSEGSANGIGGVGGNASGGVIALNANGGTINMPINLGGDPLFNASNIAGWGGNSSNGSSADGTSTGGRVSLSASDISGSNGLLNLGATVVAANGDNAGRVEIRATNGGEILFANLFVENYGLAPATSGNVLTASSGILLQADGGIINGDSQIELNSEGSIGLYANGAGSISANEGFFADAGDQIVIRHANRSSDGLTLEIGDGALTAGSNIISDADAVVRAYGGFTASATTGIDLGIVDLALDNIFTVSDGDLVIRDFAGTAALNGSGANVTIGSTADILTIGSIFAENGDANVTSSDISLSGGSIFASDRIILRNSDASQTTTVGGFGPRAGYHLDAEEFWALGSDTIIIETANATGTQSPLMVVSSFEFLTGDAGVDLTLRSAGNIEVAGEAILRGEYSNNILNVEAAGDLEMIGMGNALRVESFATGDAPAGVLNVTANRVIVAGVSGRGRLESATTPEEYEAALARSEEAPPANGSLSADRMNITVTEALFVQNSEDSGEDINMRRGLTYGAGGLNINTAANTIIVINGIRQEANGIASGADALAGVTINGDAPSNASRFNRQSVMNSCLIVNPTVCGPDAFIPTEFPIPPIRIIVEEPVTKDDEEVEADDREASAIPDSLISVRDLNPMSGEPLVDDPVTGAGNDDLWGPVTE